VGVLYGLESFIELALGARRRNSHWQLVARRYNVSLPRQSEVDRCPPISYGLCQEGYFFSLKAYGRVNAGAVFFFFLEFAKENN